MALNDQYEVLIHRHARYVLVAVIGGREKCAEAFYAEGPERSILGNVYRGKVMRVMHQLGAAFIDIGLEKQAFLPLSQLDMAQSMRLTEGSTLLVQVIKNPRDNKGPKVVPLQSIASRYFVWKPDMRDIHCSRRMIDAAERVRLLDTYKKLIAESQLGAGGVIRTQAAHMNEDCLNKDWQLLVDFHARLEATQLGLLLDRQDFPMAYFIDVIKTDVVTIWFDDPALFHKTQVYCRKYWPNFLHKIQLFDNTTSMLQRHSVDQVLTQALFPKVMLPSGGDIYIQKTEGMWVVDVNGVESPLVTNSEAAREIARQIRLRNMGGLIVIDFVRLHKSTEQQAVISVLQKEMLSDTEKAHCAGFTASGLVEIIRERTHSSLQEVLTTECNICHGLGYQRI